MMKFPITSEYNRLTVYSFAIIFCLCALMTYYVTINTLGSMAYMDSVGDAALVTIIIVTFLCLTAYSFYECLDILKTRISCTETRITQQTLLREKIIPFEDITSCRLHYRFFIVIKDNKNTMVYFFKGLQHFKQIQALLRECGYLHEA